MSNSGGRSPIFADCPKASARYGAAKPKARTIATVVAIGDKITRHDMPIPIVAAGSDGSIAVITATTSPQRELSCFVEADGITILLVRNGEMHENVISTPAEIEPFVRELFSEQIAQTENTWQGEQLRRLARTTALYSRARKSGD